MELGLKRLGHDWRHRRERFRQFLGIALVAAYSVAGDPSRAWLLGGVIVVVLGISIRLWASGHIRKNRELATTGPYAYVRHPLYLGNILILGGFAAAARTWWSGPMAIVLLLVFYPPAIRKEDEGLRSVFGAAWEDWRAGTPALLPKRRPAGISRSSWSLRQTISGNAEHVITMYLAVCMWFLYTRLP